MNGVFWLASYPKSGNTWLRLMLDHYLGDAGHVDINAATKILLYSGRRTAFGEAIGVDAGDLTAAEVLAWRPAALRAEIERTDHPVLIKTHDACVSFAPLHPRQSRYDGYPTRVPVNTPHAIALIPPDITLGALYLVRDPRDVAPSLAAHLGICLDDAITMMANDQQLMGKSWNKQPLQLWQFWSSWRENVTSWLTAASFPMQTIRYEDMRTNPAHVLRQALSLLGLAKDEDKIASTVTATSLDHLRQQEKQFGFKERAKGDRFFGDGLIGGWRTRLSTAQIQRIEADHGAVMERLGYL